MKTLKNTLQLDVKTLFKALKFGKICFKVQGLENLILGKHSRPS
jgi:hypothetical protein